MGQGAESGGKLIEAFLQQDAGHRVNHLALQPDLDRSGPVEFAVFGFDRHHGMNKLMHEDAENFFRLREIGANEDFEMLIDRRGRMPALANSIAFPPGGRKANRKPYLVGQGIAAAVEVGAQFIGSRTKPAFARVVIVGC